MTITKDKVATFDYTLTSDEGEILDTSTGFEPLAYIHGHQNIIPGLERELEGKNSGDKFSCAVKPEDGYGVWSEDSVFTVGKAQFEEPDKITEGMQFEIETAQGHQPVSICKIEGDTVTIDANHPLAGKTLHFEVAVVDVRDATAEEIEHGHLHSEGGCGEGCGEECGEGCGCDCGHEH
jgi:FKBP-type peptidyl-prolyl cis-trans isomerase SlyD